MKWHFFMDDEYYKVLARLTSCPENGHPAIGMIRQAHRLHILHKLISK